MDTDARNEIVMENIGLVVAEAKKLRGRGLEIPDMIQSGVIGLILGIEHFQPEKGYKLCTYVGYWIRREIYAAIRSHPHTIKVPPKSVAKARRFLKIKADIIHDTGCIPLDREVMEIIAPSSRFKRKQDLVNTWECTASAVATISSSHFRDRETIESIPASVDYDPILSAMISDHLGPS